MVHALNQLNALAASTDLALRLKAATTQVQITELCQNGSDTDSTKTPCFWQVGEANNLQGPPLVVMDMLR